MRHFQRTFAHFDDHTKLSSGIFAATRVLYRPSLRKVCPAVCVKHTIRNRVVIADFYACGFKDLSPNCTRLQVTAVKPVAAFAPLLAVCTLQGLTA